MPKTLKMEPDRNSDSSENGLKIMHVSFEVDHPWYLVILKGQIHTYIHAFQQLLSKSFKTGYM
jgi:hypothetical protein